ncbi:MAG TPA: autotransporter assembly complex family protein [Acetobacteraceae bacterium]|nr:autotransporter assembly complex family protein [Acetobacteraceae bacterium]
MRRLLLLPLVTLWLGAASLPGLAADPQPYAVTLAPTGNAALDTALHDSSSLISLQKTAPVGGFALIGRARQDLDPFATALHSFGYYGARTTITIDGRALDTPDLADTIDHLPAQPPVSVDVRFDLGPQFHLGQVVIQGAVPPDARAKLGLAPGQPALAADVLAAQARLLTAIQDDGYPLAKVDLPPATLHPDRNLLDVTFVASAGVRAPLGPITITGLTHMHEKFVRRHLRLRPGERFSPTAIATAQQDLQSLGVFSVVRIVPADHLTPDGTLPISVEATERPLHAVDAGIAYSTDLGVNFNLGWHDRNLFGNAEQLNLTAATNLGGDAETQPGYQFGAQFIKPDFLAHDQSLEIDLQALKQDLQAYDQTALLQKFLLDRKLSPHWTFSYGVSGEQETIEQESVTRHYELVGLPLTLKFDNTDSLLDPTHGIRATLTAIPTGALGSNDTGFFILQAAGSTYLDLSGNGRSVLALRGLVGEVPGTNSFSLPPDQRFYAGGSATVRGFKYQSVGPLFPDRTPQGGTAISAGTMELRQRIMGNYGAVAFVDAGQVSADGVPFSESWRIGVGVGFRYYTSIGPIRLDVAVPVNREPGGDAFELYIGIGQAF